MLDMQRDRSRCNLPSIRRESRGFVVFFSDNKIMENLLARINVFVRVSTNVYRKFTDCMVHIISIFLAKAEPLSNPPPPPKGAVHKVCHAPRGEPLSNPPNSNYATAYWVTLRCPTLRRTLVTSTTHSITITEFNVRCLTGFSDKPAEHNALRRLSA